MHLLRYLSGQSPVLVFRLYGGELGDLRQRRCWDNDNQRRNPSTTITRGPHPGASVNLSKGVGPVSVSRSGDSPGANRHHLPGGKP